MKRLDTKHQAGFTIIELMIATLVFSVILVIITAGVLYFSNTYYASLNRASMQNTARGIVKDVTESIQFTGTAIATSDDTGANYFCAGNKIYVFQPGVMYGGGTPTAANPGLYVTPQNSGCPPLSATDYNNPNAQQLLGSKMRISAFNLKETADGMYTVSLTLAFGEDDLLTATTGNDVACKSQIGYQFCAVSSLNATVQRRLQDSQLSH
jgi:prepilin-type N-terminal cleavage/methylation domain-containing protein